MRLRVLLKVLVLATLAVALLPPNAEAASSRWTKDIEQLERRLDRSDWKGAVDRAVKLRERMLTKLDRASSASQDLARTLVVQAIGEANLGRDQAALWHWFSAQNYLEGLVDLRLEAYGRAASILEGRGLGDLPQDSSTSRAHDEAEEYVPVESLLTVEPSYPRSLKKSGKQGAVIVRIVVATDGRPHQPLVQEAGLVPTMAFPALEALKDWRFAPASRDGEPVSVYYELKIHYR